MRAMGCNSTNACNMEPSVLDGGGQRRAMTATHSLGARISNFAVSALGESGAVESVENGV